jgi:hypothetical protein
MRDLEAVQLADRVLLDRTAAERQFVRAVTRFETSYSDGWKKNHPTMANPHNWGSVTIAAGSPNGFRVTEAENGGEQAWMRIYPSDEAGLADAAREMLRRPGVREALAGGDGAGAIRAMGVSRYFTADPELYIAGVQRHFAAMLGATGETALLRFTTVGIGAPGSGARVFWDVVLSLGLVGGLGYLVWRKSNV